MTQLIYHAPGFNGKLPKTDISVILGCATAEISVVDFIEENAPDHGVNTFLIYTYYVTLMKLIYDLSDMQVVYDTTDISRDCG